MATPVVGLATSTPTVAGQPVIAISANQAGGFIVNPLAPADQGLTAAEPLFVNQVASAGLSAYGTTIALQPGQSYTIIPNTTTPVSVCSNSASHRFTAVMWPTP
jgi:hypothetical protein